MAVAIVVVFLLCLVGLLGASGLAWAAPTAGKLPDYHTITITVSRDNTNGKEVADGGGETAIGGGGTGGKKTVTGGGGNIIIGDGKKDVTTGGKNTGGGATASGKLPDYHTITITVNRGESKQMGGIKIETGSFGGGPKDITIGGEVVIGGGSEHQQKSEQSVSTLPGRKQANGCDFSKPQIVGMGKSGLEGLPKDFPLPPGIRKPWKYEVALGSLYAIGISAGWKNTVSFVRKALPAHGWHIIKETKEHEPNSNTDWVHLFFSNTDYCGWVSIGTTVPHAPTPTSMNIGMKKRNGGA